MSRSIIHFVVPILLVACADAGGDAPDHTARDSASIRIVENDRPEWEDGERWLVSDEPTVQIGMIDGPEEYRFDRVRGIAFLDDDRLVVGAGGSNDLRIYDAAGRHLMTIGRTGDGPGEFRSLNWFGVAGDSLLAWDSRAKRLSIFDTSGALARVVRVPAVADAFFPIAIGAFGDGSVVLTPGESPQALAASPEGPRRGERAYLRVGADPSAADTLAVLRGAETVLRRLEHGFTNIGVVFGRTTHLAVGNDVLVVGDTDAFELRALDRTGKTAMIMRRPHTPSLVTDEAVALEIERQLDAIPSTAPAAARAGMGAQLEEVGSRSTFPAFGDVLIDAEGHAWVKEFTMDDDRAPLWSVFDPSGRWLGDVRTPAGLRVMAIERDRLAGVWKDDLDVEYVRVHALGKP